MFRTVITVCAIALATSAVAQDYPNRPVRMISPNPPGGANDTIGRIIAVKLGDVLGQPMVIDNRGGAGGTLGAEIAAQANSDGYTLLAGSVSTHSFSPALKARLNYDPVKDFTPISLVGIFGFFVFSHASMPVYTIGDLIGYARANPGAINYGTGNATSILATGLFAAQQKLDMVHIPYKGDGPLSIDLIAGRVNVAIATPGTLAPQVKEGKLRVLATLLPSRNQLLPTAPTMSEAGLLNVPITPWGGLFGPPKLPKEVVDRVNREIAIVLARPEVKDAFGRLAFEPRSSTPQELSAFVAQQLDAYGRGVRAMNLSLD